ncbi:unnamed protein product [Chrysodeixis includens]|uniref:Uncharacterized protein n=1 Tax=Chrysodeixis includens TaxID=689277 RepID=A0A9P0BKS4_CHRIL|nr:unnamed protein product [Chrysodeixis includens]
MACSITSKCISGIKLPPAGISNIAFFILFTRCHHQLLSHIVPTFSNIVLWRFMIMIIFYLCEDLFTIHMYMGFTFFRSSIGTRISTFTGFRNSSFAESVPI